MSIPFIDLAAQMETLRSSVQQAIERVLDHGGFIMGPEVKQLEETLGQYCKAKHVISCANGTDALILALKIKKIQPNDAIFVPSFTFTATAETPAWLGAIPFFVDVLPDTFNMDPKSLEKAIIQAQKEGFKPKGIIPVDLFGQPADYDELTAISQKYDLWIIADAAQSFGATYRNRCVGTLGSLTTTSFFPAKPLGCYGDGGAIFTDNDEYAALLRSLQVHGQGKDKYHNIHIGINSRLDTLQAAVLLQKLSIFSDELRIRQQVAQDYCTHLQDLVTCPVLLEGCTSSWAQYTIILPPELERDRVQEALRARGIPSAIYYPIPLHQQPAYKHYPAVDAGHLPVSESLSKAVIALPMSAYTPRDLPQKIRDIIQSIL